MIWNIEGGGGVRDGLDINGDYGAYVDALEAECAQLIANAPIPTNYRTISFDGELADFDTQDIIAGDYISFGFTFLNDPTKEVGWQCELGLLGQLELFAWRGMFLARAAVPTKIQ